MTALKDAAGFDTSGTTYKLDEFVPAVWSARLLSNLNDKHLLAPLCTREYEGEIKGAGDTVKVDAIGRVTVNDYAAYGTLTYETPAGGEILIEVDTAKYFAIKMDDVIATQIKPKVMNEYTKEAAEALAKAADNYLFNVMYDAAVNDTANGHGARGGASTTNGGVISWDAPDDTSNVNTYNALCDIGVRLDDMLAPSDGRFIVLPTLCKPNLLKDSRFVAAGADGASSVRDKGIIGSIAGFDVKFVPPVTYLAGTAPTVGWDSVETTAVDAYANVRYIAGVQGAVAYVEQISKVENLRLETTFADAVRGLHVYGSGVVRPQFLVTGYTDTETA